MKSLILKVSNAFYLYQFYTVSVWMAQLYFDSVSLVIAATIITVGVSVYETRRVFNCF